MINVCSATEPYPRTLRVLCFVLPCFFGRGGYFSSFPVSLRLPWNLLCGSGWPITHHSAQGSLSLLSTGIKSHVPHLISLSFFLLLLFTYACMCISTGVCVHLSVNIGINMLCTAQELESEDNSEVQFSF